MKPKHQRLTFLLVSALSVLIALLFAMQAFRDSMIFFYSPSDIEAQKPAIDKPMRIGGLVASGSVQHPRADDVIFSVTDGKVTLRVHYHGLLPNLFREGQGVVAEGRLVNARQFEATQILAKHDENYMPKEVVDALKRSGNWRGENFNR